MQAITHLEVRQHSAYGWRLIAWQDNVVYDVVETSLDFSWLRKLGRVWHGIVVPTERQLQKCPLSVIADGERCWLVQ